MKKAEEKFQAITEKMEANFDGVAKGKMMSQEAIKYKNKVFAFIMEEQMGFKLGKDFEPDSLGITEWEYLAPFKTKPPMKAWYIIGNKYLDQWEELSELAWVKMKAIVD